MVMRFSVEQKPRALVNDDLFPALAITRKSRNRESFARSGGPSPTQSYITPSGEPTLSCGTGAWVTGGARGRLDMLQAGGGTRRPWHATESRRLRFW